MAMDKNVPPDARQEQILRSIGIEQPGDLCVINENDNCLFLRHYNTQHEVTIRKSETQKRKEKEMKLW